LDLVGRQLWRGALLLSDLLVARRAELRGKAVLELGCGVGLLGVVLRLAARGATVVVTDRDDDVLSLARRNLHVNAHLEPIDSGCGGCGGSTLAVRELDWLGAWPGEPPAALLDRTNDLANGWSADDLRTLGQLDVIVAADCIYDEALTDGLFKCLRRLLRLNPAAKVWVTLEKRFNFELATLSVQAHGYRRFLYHLGLEHSDAEATPDPPRVASTLDAEEQHLPRLKGRQLPLDFPKYLNYDRAPQLELWEITSAAQP
jgi:predicted nicotinamide N-methyase